MAIQSKPAAVGKGPKSTSAATLKAQGHIVTTNAGQTSGTGGLKAAKNVLRQTVGKVSRK